MLPVFDLDVWACISSQNLQQALKTSVGLLLGAGYSISQISRRFSDYGNINVRFAKILQTKSFVHRLSIGDICDQEIFQNHFSCLIHLYSFLVSLSTLEIEPIQSQRRK